MPTVIPYIPRNITVHLGSPNSDAPNVTVPFVDYVKNVASSEIYPTWDDAALRANIYAIVSFALNRVYTEFYRSRGYPFDITNSTAIDQYFVNGRSYFENVSRLVDELYNDYLRRPGFVEPLAAKFCNGTTVKCEGLSQWGSQELAQQGLNSVEILRRYYGSFEIVEDAPSRGIQSSYPGTPLKRGSQGPNVVVVQAELNRISQSYPAIAKVPKADGIFGPKTESSVRSFQRIFGLEPDGIVGKATWYELIRLYTAIQQLSELKSKGQQFYSVSWAYPNALRQGDRGQSVRQLQYMLTMLSEFISQFPPLEVDGIFGPATRQSVLAAQRYFELEETGVVDPSSWDRFYDQYAGIQRTALDAKALLPETRPDALARSTDLKQFPGQTLKPGMRDSSR